MRRLFYADFVQRALDRCGALQPDERGTATGVST
jgi:hypothetical protein